MTHWAEVAFSIPDGTDDVLMIESSDLGAMPVVWLDTPEHEQALIFNWGKRRYERPERMTVA